MSFSSGTYSLYATGNPVVTNTTISSTWANNTLNDIATALSTCLLKDGTQTATASIGFAQGIDVTTGITTPSTTFALANTTATTINFAGAATTLNVGAGASSTLNANFTTAINLNTAAIVSNQTTVAVINTNATTVNAFGAASVALNIGHASAAAAFAGGISIPTGKSVTGAGTATVTGFASVSATNFIASGVTCTAFAGATTTLTIGGTGATSVFAIPGTLDATSATAGSVTMAGGLAVAKAIYSGSSIVSVAGTFVGGSDSNTTFFTSTSDGSDNRAIQISSGSAYSSTRGGGIQMYGNETASIGGNVYVDAGNTATDGSVLLRTGDNITGIKVARGASGTAAGAVTIASLAGTGTRAVVVDANGVLSAP